MIKVKTAYCSLTYLFSFSAAELGLPVDATEAEIETAAEAKMEKIASYISEQTDFFPQRFETSVN